MRILVVAALAVGGCSGCSNDVSIRMEVRDLRTGAPITDAVVEVDGESTAVGRTLSFEAERGETIRISAPEHCPSELDWNSNLADAQVHLRPRIELQPVLAQVGFDRELRIEATTPCDDPSELTWRQTSGRPLEGRMRIDAGVLVVRTHPLEVPEDQRAGVLAFDRATRGDYRFELRVGDSIVTTRVVAGPTAAGIFQVPTGADVYLSGGAGGQHRWSLLNQPDESQAIIEGDRIALFRPDRFGTYLVEHHPSNQQFSFQAGAYEDVPRDCGRVGCHRDEAQGWTTTAHATTFRRGVNGELGEFEMRCWACHATGVDVGIENGGLHHTAASIGFEARTPAPGRFDALPRRVRRNGSVWCSACHGPGRIVPPNFEWQWGAKFQVGVCARCHDVDEADPDANHRSAHVDEWRRAPMSTFTRALRPDDPALRPECSRCHSAQGFVEHVRRGGAWEIDPGLVEPLTCTTCHDAHGK